MRGSTVSVAGPRTYNQATYRAATAAWADGEYGPAWNEVRRIAAERGFLYPPSGTPQDDRDDESPSQRAIIWRAIEDNPGSLRAIVRRSKSWHEVVERVIAMEREIRIEAGELDVAPDPDLPNHPQSVAALRSILERLR